MTSIAIAAAALVTAVLSVTPAHAAYGPDQPVYVQVTANDGTGLQLARLEGTIAFDDSNTKFRYSLRFCWQSAYPQPSFVAVINGSTTAYLANTGYTTAGGCQQVRLYDSAVTSGTVIRNLRFDVTAGWFSSVNYYQYMTRTKSSITYDNPFN